MRFIGIAITCVIALGGLGIMPPARPAVAQSSASFIALVAAGRGGSIPGSGDITIVRVGANEIRIVGTIFTTGTTTELAVSPTGTYALALSPRERLASVITGLDTAQPRETRLFTTGSGPNAVAITPDGTRAVILNGQENPPTAMIFEGLPDAPRQRGTSLPIPGATLGTELDIAMFDSGNSVAISTGCGGLIFLDGITTGTPTFRPSSPFTMAGCIQGLDLAPGDTSVLTASRLGAMFAVLRLSGAQPGGMLALAERTPMQSSTISNLRLSPDGSTIVVSGFQGIYVYRLTEMGILPIKLVTISPQLRHAQQGGVTISPDNRIALVVSLDSQEQTRLSVVSDLSTDNPEETAQLNPSPQINTLRGAQQSIAFIPVAAPMAFVREQEPNDSIVQSNLVIPDVTILGAFDVNGDADYFSFDAKAQDRVRIETRAQRLSPASSADTTLTLFDGNGVRLAENDDHGNSLDSRLEFTIPTTGRYVFRVGESRNKGGINFNYEVDVRLNAN